MADGVPADTSFLDIVTNDDELFLNRGGEGMAIVRTGIPCMLECVVSV